MRVLWFTNTPANASEYLKEGPIGGGWIKSLDKALQSDVELHVAFYYPKLGSAFKHLQTTYHPIIINNWKFKAIKEIFFHNFTDQQDLPRYLRLIVDINPDIIHIHGTENPFGCIILKTSIPVIISIQGCMTVYNHKYLAGFNKKELRLWRLNFQTDFRKILRQRSFLRILKEYKKVKFRELKNLRNTQYIIGRTAWDRRITSILSPHSVYFHCDEIMREIFYEKVWRLEGKKRMIVHTTIGNNPYKGFETICEAFFELNHLIGDEMEWQIAGIGEDDEIVKITKRKLREKFPKHGLKYLGNIDEGLLSSMLCRADIYVSSSHIENSPNSLCEAMLVGMPCIATFAGGTGSLIKDEEDGLLVQDGDPWALAGAILELYRNPDLRFRLGTKAREMALARHDPKRITIDLLRIYRSVIQMHGQVFQGNITNKN